MKSRVDTRAFYILGAIAMTEGTWVLVNAVINGAGFWRYLGFAPDRWGGWQGWVLGFLTASVFVVQALRLPSVRASLFQPTRLKAMGLLVAIAAGILEEVFFRKQLMEYVLSVGGGAFAQILASACAFGAVHGFWGLIGRNMRAAVGATMATGALGAALALTYLAAGRSLAPCIAAHALLDALLEPGLVLAAFRGEMNSGGKEVRAKH